MDASLTAALDYLPRWIEHQMRIHAQPGCSVAVAINGEVMLEQAFGHANLDLKTPLTPRHRFRVASHSKSFTAAGIMKLREQGSVHLDDPIGRFVPSLHPKVADARLAQLLSHSAGLVRDGGDAGQWFAARDFKTADEIIAELADGPVLPPGIRFKYSNHGYALLGMAIAAVTGETWASWIAREVIATAGLTETLPDAPAPVDVPFANGHSALYPLGRRLVVPAAMPTHAIAAAGGFVSTASDLVRFFASLDPDAPQSILTPESRREMTHARWHEPDASFGRWYGLGIITGNPADPPQAQWFGHSGVFPGTLSRTAVMPGRGLAVSIITNAADGLANAWVDGAYQIANAFTLGGAPRHQPGDWLGRWWSPWAAYDLVPIGEQIVMASPGLPNPFLDAPRLAPQGDNRERMRVVSAPGLSMYGEDAWIERDAGGGVASIRIGPMRLVQEQVAAAELLANFGSSLSVE